MSDISNRWGRPGFEQEIKSLKSHNDLRSATAALSMTTRQRIFAYIQKGGTFKRGTWNGCVMNAASDGNVSSLRMAAEHFGETVPVISNFIGAWDSTSYVEEARATIFLERILLECGLTTESPKPEPIEYEKVKVFRVRLFTSKETELVEELRAEIDAGAFDEDFAKFQELVSV